MSVFLFGVGVGAGLYLTGILYVIAAHWRPTPWWGRFVRPSPSQKTWNWKRRYITKRWPCDGWPRWTL